MSLTTMITATESLFAARSFSPATLGHSLAVLGQEQPVVYDELMAAPVVLRHKDVSAALRNTGTFSTAFYGRPPLETSMMAQHGYEHTRQRRIHNRFFNPVASARYTERVRTVAWNTVANLAGRTRAELMTDMIDRYPMAVFLDLLGIPDDLGDDVLAWVRAVVTWLGSPMDEEATEDGRQAYQKLRAATDMFVNPDCPGHNLLGEIVRAHLEEGVFSVDACTVAVVNLLLGGLETTIQMLSGALASLLLNPVALAVVRADHSRIGDAVDEAFRWANPSAGLYRLVTEDAEIAGTPLPAGSMVYLCIAAAHYDSAAHWDPELFDLNRHAAHLGFGLGPHYCVGAPLAKIEVCEALAALLEMFPNLRLDPIRSPTFRYGARGFVQHGTEALNVLL